MSGPVVFSYANFVAAYPEFAACSDPQLQNYFDMSDAFFGNDTTNPAFGLGVDRMTRLAYMLTAHIAWLMAPRDGQGNPSANGKPAAQTVGQITSASEGSVSVGLAEVAKGGANELAAWFAQTKYGFMFWQSTSQFRTAVYLANPTFVPSSIYPLFPRGRW
jgi:hypothetical protein